MLVLLLLHVKFYYTHQLVMNNLFYSQSHDGVHEDTF